MLGNTTLVHAEDDAWGFDSGVNPYEKGAKWIKENYVTDYDIWKSILSGYSDDPNQVYYQAGVSGNKVETVNGTVIGYPYYSDVHIFSDRKLYDGMIHLTGVGTSKFKDLFQKDGKFSEIASERDYVYKSVAQYNKALKPSNAERYSPLNMLRILQLYCLSRDGEDKCLIGGWPVQVKIGASGGEYEIQGARTIDLVYLSFTGKKYNKTKALEKVSDGDNCKKDSVCYKLWNGDINMNKAVKLLKEELEDRDVQVRSGSDLFTEGNYGIDGYIAKCLRKEKSIDSNINTGVTALPYPDVFDDEFGALSTRTNLGEVEKTKLFCLALFRFYEEFGIHFLTYNEGNEGENSIFIKDSPDSPFPVVVEGDGNWTITNLKSREDDEDPVGGLIAYTILLNLHKYVDKDSNSYIFSGSSEKESLHTIAIGLLDAIYSALISYGESKPEDTLKRYIRFEEGSAIGSALEEIEVTERNTQLSQDVNEVNNDRQSSLSGKNELNNISDAYVVEFFIGLATDNGNTESYAINNEYQKIMEILSRPHVQNGKPTVEECYSMSYSMTVIKDQNGFSHTWKAQDSTQLGAIMKYCKDHMARVKKYFYKARKKANGEKDKFGLDADGIQKNSDFVMALLGIRTMGSKAYGRAYPNVPSSSRYSKFLNEFKIWQSSLKTGLTKNDKGVQHQDGFVPYGLEYDTDELKESTPKFFKDKDNSLDGKNIVKDGEKKKNSQKKILKWGLDLDEVNSDLKENFWFGLVNTCIGVIGTLMFGIGMCVTLLYIFDHVSSNHFELTKKLTFGRLQYSFEPKVRRNTIIKFSVFCVLSVMLYQGTIVKWALYIVEVVYYGMTTK